MSSTLRTFDQNKLTFETNSVLLPVEVLSIFYFFLPGTPLLPPVNLFVMSGPAAITPHPVSIERPIVKRHSATNPVR
jgi:hypothetical protein